MHPWPQIVVDEEEVALKARAHADVARREDEALVEGAEVLLQRMDHESRLTTKECWIAGLLVTGVVLLQMMALQVLPAKGQKLTVQPWIRPGNTSMPPKQLLRQLQSRQDPV